MTWWTAGGASGAVAVYQPIGAVSLAASYTDLSGTGNDATVANAAPSWAAGVGWTFNGSNQMLDSGVTGASGYTILVRYSGAAINGAPGTDGMTGHNSASTRGLALYPRYSDATPHVDRPIAGNPGLDIATANGTGQASGVMAAAGATMYLDGAPVSTTTLAARSYDTGQTCRIGGQVFSGAQFFWAGTIEAVAIYSGTLDADEVAAVSSAMAALPDAGTSPVPIIMQAHAAAGWR